MTPSRIDRIATAWAVAAGILTVIRQVAAIAQPFSYIMAFITADIATTARAFASQGFLVPVNNNPPVGAEVSAYLHWPPLTPILLGTWYRMFGVSETSTHAFSLAVAVVAATGVWLLARLVLGRTGAMIALFAWCSFPVNVEYLHLPSQQALGMALAILSLICAIGIAEKGGRGRMVLGLVLIGTAVASTWEAALLGPGLVIGGHFIVHRREVVRVGLYYSLAAAVAAGGILAAYILTYPHLFSEMSGTVLYRLGLPHSYGSGRLYAHSYSTHLTYLNLVRMIADNLSSMLGALGLLSFGVAGTAILDLGRDERDWQAHAAIVSTGFLWMIWYAVFSNHVAIHAFESGIAAPCIALAVAWCALRIVKNIASMGRVQQLAFTVGLPVLALAPLLVATMSAIKQNPEAEPFHHLVEHGKEIGRITNPGSVIVSSSQSTIPMFYSGRHFIRAVPDEKTLMSMMPSILGNFAPSTPVYLATSKLDEDLFPSILHDPRREHILGAHVMLTRLDHPQ